jgi:DNA-binding NarL/FixJ family response regulator
VRFLIVDDAAPMGAVLAHVLTSLGHEVAGVVADAPAALALAAAVAPDAVAVDGRLGEPGALALVAELRSTVPDAAVLLVASLGETALVRAARETGAAGALARPFVRSRVAAALWELQTARGADPR